ncbi:MAG: type II toxin-antitoxin system mRNA interferase toxin, RelE/StbE family [Candidatus Melainabacteria bacterium]|nr:type II toxin-antitoxin system mRNA interferase toxin, RelE/StbE family [Candidatus Melainabacteria bacterium]
MKYKLEYSSSFRRDSKKLIKQRKFSSDLLVGVLELLASDPFNAKLRTHKVTDRQGKAAWSSRVNSDIRILWNYKSDGGLSLLLIARGGHSGGYNVYK